MPGGDQVAEAELPPTRIEVCRPERREPGTVYFNVRQMPGRKGAPARGWLLALEQGGSLRCVYAGERAVQGIKATPSGTLLVSIIDGLILEMTTGGKVIRSWHATGRYRDRAPPAGSIAVAAETFHHGVNQLANGNLLLLSMEVRSYPDWPGSTSEQAAPRETARLVGDILIEVQPDGCIVREHRLLDILDPYRITYGSRALYWAQRGYAGTFDWCHANGTWHDPRDDSVLVSLRTQDCIVKIDRKTGALGWILGDHGNWRKPWSDKLLRPVGQAGWSYHQHDCSVTPAGTVMCFDNGNNRAVPFAPPLPHSDNASRAVEYAVDEVRMTAEQVWSFGEAPPHRIFAGFQGGARRLPATGNTIIAFGGICTRSGLPVEDPDADTECRARLVEVTPSREVVLDMSIGGAPGDPRALSVFKAEHVPA
jgi:arylsulfate sulfotransferase